MGSIPGEDLACRIAWPKRKVITKSFVCACPVLLDDGCGDDCGQVCPFLPVSSLLFIEYS